MKILAVLALALLLAPAPAGPAPACTSTLVLPDSGLELTLRWRQVGTDVSRYLEGEAPDARTLGQLRVQCLLNQGLELDSDVGLRAGEVLLPPGRWKLGFTVAAGGAPRFFAVVGQQALDLPGREVAPGFESSTLLLQWLWTDRTRAALHWHLGTRAGAIDFALGAEGTREQRAAPPPPEPQAEPDAGPPRDG